MRILLNCIDSTGNKFEPGSVAVIIFKTGTISASLHTPSYREKFWVVFLVFSQACNHKFLILFWSSEHFWALPTEDVEMTLCWMKIVSTSLYSIQSIPHWYLKGVDFLNRQKLLKWLWCGSFHRTRGAYQRAPHEIRHQHASVKVQVNF